MLSCVLVVFAAGLHRQLRARTAAESLVPGIAVAGLWLVAVAQLLGAGHWIGTIPWLWGGAGLSGLALASAALRQGAYARWLAG